jgi:protein-L-isoaspartate(D-aspartate) O-methyltransferase
MVDEQIARRGIRDERVLAAMRRVERHLFVPESQWFLAYGDHPLPVGEGQTISQPYIVALMTEALGLEGGERVLEVGTGSGYQAAILAELAQDVYTVEILPALAERADATLKELGYRNIHLRVGDGSEGWAEHAPYQGILVTAAPPEVPPALLEQLAEGGRLVIPVGVASQELELYTRNPEGLDVQRLAPVRFVPLTHRKR